MYKVLKVFRDSETKEEYEVGQEIKLSPARAIEIVGKLGVGFIEYIEAKEKPATKKDKK